eukprot:TRINITY_DN1477_c0_g1_i2.p1 TRINITY_DN1477_c0_g1~~TRINITY_DN1477_c0_g1_i2.p1  ORF type:complete len:200 (-),score=23.29 TRINITY_DN1477_c0_g1_i2:96-671(-)
MRPLVIGAIIVLLSSVCLAAPVPSCIAPIIYDDFCGAARSDKFCSYSGGKDLSKYSSTQYDLKASHNEELCANSASSFDAACKEECPIQLECSKTRHQAVCLFSVEEFCKPLKLTPNENGIGDLCTSDNDCLKAQLQCYSDCRMCKTAQQCENLVADGFVAKIDDEFCVSYSSPSTALIVSLPLAFISLLL